MKQSERFALREWLSDYPTDKTYDEIIDILTTGEEVWVHPDISVMEVVEHHTLEQVARMIDNTRMHFEHVTDNFVTTAKDIFNLATENRPDDDYAGDFDARLNRMQVMIQEWEDA